MRVLYSDIVQMRMGVCVTLFQPVDTNLENMLKADSLI